MFSFFFPLLLCPNLAGARPCPPGFMHPDAAPAPDARRAMVGDAALATGEEED